MVKITAARFDSFLKSSVILENIDTIIYKFQLCIYVGHFLKVFIQLYGIFFLLLSEVIYHLLCMCSNSSKWVTKRDREIKIYIFEHCVGGGGGFLHNNFRKLFLQSLKFPTTQQTYSPPPPSSCETMGCVGTFCKRGDRRGLF